jgi:hypothetical protein
LKQSYLANLKRVIWRGSEPAWGRVGFGIVGFVRDSVLFGLHSDRHRGGWEQEILVMFASSLGRFAYVGCVYAELRPEFKR